MELNPEHASRFMETAYIRRDVFVTKGVENRIHDYDQVGNVRVGKFLKMPTFGKTETRRNDVTTVEKDTDSWNINIADQTLADRVVRRTSTDKSFDDAYTSAFSEEVQGGLRTILKQEKLLNSGEFNISFLASWGLSAFMLDAFVAFLNLLSSASSPEDFSKTLVVGAGVLPAGNAIFNGVKLYRAIVDEMDKKSGYYLHSTRFPLINLPSMDEPFTRRKLKDVPMPPVPLDRLIKGNVYL